MSVLCSLSFVCTYTTSLTVLFCLPWILHVILQTYTKETVYILHLYTNISPVLNSMPPSIQNQAPPTSQKNLNIMKNMRNIRTNRNFKLLYPETCLEIDSFSLNYFFSWNDNPDVSCSSIDKYICLKLILFAQFILNVNEYKIRMNKFVWISITTQHTSKYLRDKIFMLLLITKCHSIKLSHPETN